MMSYDDDDDALFGGSLLGEQKYAGYMMVMGYCLTSDLVKRLLNNGVMGVLTHDVY